MQLLFVVNFVKISLVYEYLCSNLCFCYKLLLIAQIKMKPFKMIIVIHKKNLLKKSARSHFRRYQSTFFFKAMRICKEKIIENGKSTPGTVYKTL